MLTKLLRNKRFDRKITQEHIAKKLGLTTNSYRNKELGITQFTLKEFQILVIELGITMLELNEIFFAKEIALVQNVETSIV